MPAGDHTPTSFRPKRKRDYSRRVPRQRDPDELLRPVDLGLTNDELELIVAGIGQWGGPASPRPESARLVGFATAEQMTAEFARRKPALRDRQAITRREWRRILVATELIFASDVYGAGVEWETVTGRDEAADLRLLRGVQRKLAAV